MRIRAMFAVLVAVAGCEDAPQTPPAGRSVALLLTSKTAADAGTAVTIADGLERLAGEVDGLTLLRGAALGERLGSDANAKLAACGADLGCIGALGEKAGVDDVVFLAVGLFLAVTALCGLFLGG